ncbi:MAG: hypothetical protein ACLFP4_02685 [Spirochaetales bacterium]
MDPAMIGVFVPILALCIPIVAIISSGRTKRAKLNAQSDNAEVKQLRHRVAELEQQVHLLTHTMLELEQQQEFTARLIEKDPRQTPTR